MFMLLFVQLKAWLEAMLTENVKRAFFYLNQKYLAVTECSNCLNLTGCELVLYCCTCKCFFYEALSGV